MTVDPALEVVSVGKAFPGVVALRDVSLRATSGEIHALVGENGAGKSTLVKIIAGAFSPDSGSVSVGGRRLGSYTPRDARSHGVAVIHQERQIAPDLGVVENVLLGHLPRNALGWVDWKRARRVASEALRDLGLEIDTDARVRDLSNAQLQLIESARAMCLGAHVVIMDEPTSALSARDAEQLFATARRLRQRGACVLYISHHLQEVLDLADRISVLRDGRLVETVEAADVDEARLAEMIIGRPLPSAKSRTRSDITRDSTPVIRFTRVSLAPVLKPVSFDVHPGEVVCVSGLIGSGRQELAHIAAGVIAPTTGEVDYLGGRLRSVRDAVRSGIAYAPDDRRRYALLTGRTALENIALGPLVSQTSRLRRPRSERELATRIALDVDADPRRLDDQIEKLSGGNQQKIVLGRCIATQPRLFVLDEPTAGVDVGARSEIYRVLRARAAEGAAVLCFSSDIDEILEIGDRVLVLRSGELAGELHTGEFDVDDVYALQMGITQE